MTDFSQVYKRINTGKKRAKNFQELLTRFQGKKSIVTDKQKRALAIEANQYNIRTNEKNRKGEWRNIVNKEKVKGPNAKSRLPIWRENDVRKERGSVININTGERYKTRYAKGKHKGRMMKKEKWTYTNKKGKTQLIYPKEKKKGKNKK